MRRSLGLSLVHVVAITILVVEGFRGACRNERAPTTATRRVVNHVAWAESLSRRASNAVVHQDPTSTSALRLSAGMLLDAASVPLKTKVERLRRELDLAQQWKEDNPNIKAVDQSESTVLLSPSRTIESLTALTSGIAHQLEEIWDELGYNPEERELQLSDLLDKFQDLGESKVAEEREVADTFRQSIAETRDELRTASKLLKTPVDPELLGDDSGLTLTEELKRLETALKGIRTAVPEARKDLSECYDTINGHHESLNGAGESLARENEFQLEAAVETPTLPDAPILTRPTFPKADASSASKADVISRLKIELDLARQFFEGATAESTITLDTGLNGALENAAAAREAPPLNGIETTTSSKVLFKNDKLDTELADQSIENVKESVVAAPVVHSVTHSMKQSIPLEQVSGSASSTLDAPDIFQPVTQESFDAPPVPMKTKIARLKAELERAREWMAASTPIKPAPPPYQREQPEAEHVLLADVEEVILDDRISIPTAEAMSATTVSMRTKIERLKSELKLAEQWLAANTPIKPAPPPYQREHPKMEQVVPTDVEATIEEVSPDDRISMPAAEAESTKSVSLRTKIERLKVELKLAEQWLAANTPIKAAPPPYQSQRPEAEPIVAKDVGVTTEPDDLTSTAEVVTTKSVSLRTKIERLKAELKLAEQWMAANTPIKPAPPPYQSQQPEAEPIVAKDVGVTTEPDDLTSTAEVVTTKSVSLRTKIERLKAELKLAEQWMAANTPIKPAPPPYQSQQPEAEPIKATDVGAMTEPDGSIPLAEAETAKNVSLRTKIERLKTELELAEQWMAANTPIKPAPPPYQSQQPEAEPIKATDVGAMTEPDGSISTAEAETAKSVSLRTKIERLKTELELAEQWMAANTPIKPAPPPYERQQPDAEPIVATDVGAMTEPDGSISTAEAETAKSVSLRTKIERLKTELKLAEQWMAANTPIKPAPPPYQGHPTEANALSSENVNALASEAGFEMKGEPMPAPVLPSDTESTTSVSFRKKIEKLKVEIELARKFFEQAKADTVTLFERTADHFKSFIAKGKRQVVEKSSSAEDKSQMEPVSLPLEMESFINQPKWDGSSETDVPLRTKIERLKAELELAQQWMETNRPFRPITPSFQAMPPTVNALPEIDEISSLDNGPEGLEIVAEPSEPLDVPIFSETVSSVSDSADEYHQYETATSPTPLRTKMDRLKIELELARKFFDDAMADSTMLLDFDAKIEAALLTNGATRSETAEASTPHLTPPETLPSDSYAAGHSIDGGAISSYIEALTEEEPKTSIAFEPASSAASYLDGLSKPQPSPSHMWSESSTDAPVSVPTTGSPATFTPVQQSTREDTHSFAATPVEFVDDGTSNGPVPITEPPVRTTVTSDFTDAHGDPASAALKTEMELLRAQLNRAKEWQETITDSEPVPSVLHGSKPFVDSLQLDESSEPLSTEIEMLKLRLERAREWQETGMDIKPAPPVLDGYQPVNDPLNGLEEATVTRLDTSPDSLNANIESLKIHIERAKQWQESGMNEIPSPPVFKDAHPAVNPIHADIPSTDVLFESEDSDALNGLKSAAVDANERFPAANGQLDTASDMLKREMELLKIQLERANKWQETIKPAPPVFPGYEPVPDPLNDLTPPMNRRL